MIPPFMLSPAVARPAAETVSHDVTRRSGSRPEPDDLVTALCADATAAAALNVPRHLAFVLDAPRHADPAGSLEALRHTVAGCQEEGVRWLSILLPTPENGTTAACERLLAALRQYVHHEAIALAARGVRLAALASGSWDACGSAAHALVRALEEAKRRPVAAEALQLRLGVACGGRA
ncbi:MAG: hypothetical protein NTW87_28325, partial [Planctomycetota bacterium]|nr:hypothetical protein [Planctomycetota bacterium]